MAVSADEYWSSYELGTAENLSDAIDLAVAASHEARSSWVWRGQADARWGLHSTLGRLLRRKLRHWPSENETAEAEIALFAEAERWGLNWSSRGRLSALELLALIRHHGAPSRFIDVSGSLAVALHDACVPVRGKEDVDGRMFAFDGDGQAKTNDFAELEEGNLNRRPAWWTEPPLWWTTEYTIWRAPAVDDRIVRQQGAFLISGVPVTANNQKWYLHRTGPNSGERYESPLTLAEVHRVTSVGVRCHGAAGRGGQPTHPVRNFRVAARAKASILDDLQKLFGLSASGLYPDAAGYKEFGVPSILK